MIQRLMVLFFISAFVVSCGSTKKKDSEDLGDGISSTEMSFDPSGSDSGKIEGLETVRFGYDQASLTSDAKEALQGNADWIKNHQNVSIQVEGHADSRGSIEYNLALGERRARAVKAYLVSLGVDADRLNVISFGEEKPLADGDTEAAHARNRRVNFVPIPN